MCRGTHRTQHRIEAIQSVRAAVNQKKVTSREGIEVPFVGQRRCYFNKHSRVLLTADDDCATRAEKYDSLSKQTERTAPVSEELDRRSII